MLHASVSPSSISCDGYSRGICFRLSLALKDDIQLSSRVLHHHVRKKTNTLIDQFSTGAPATTHPLRRLVHIDHHDMTAADFTTNTLFSITK